MKRAPRSMIEHLIRTRARYRGLHLKYKKLEVADYKRGIQDDDHIYGRKEYQNRLEVIEAVIAAYRYYRKMGKF